MLYLTTLLLSSLLVPLTLADSSLTINVWTSLACQGVPSEIDPLTKNNNTAFATAALSYKLSRNMAKGEFLDFSSYAPPSAGTGDMVYGEIAACALFVEKTNPDTNGHLLVANTCYGFLRGGLPDCVKWWSS